MKGDDWMDKKELAELYNSLTRTFTRIRKLIDRNAKIPENKKEILLKIKREAQKILSRIDEITS